MTGYPGKSFTGAYVRKLVPEKLIQVVKATYEGACTTVRTCEGVSKEFDIKIGLHQGSVLSLFLFTIVIDVLSKDEERSTLGSAVC